MSKKKIYFGIKFLLVLLFLSLPLKAVEENNSRPKVLKGIYGNAGHIGIELSFGVNTFDYYYSRNEHYFNYLSKVNTYNLKFDGAITYFATDFNRYSFLLKSDVELSLSSASYKSFSFGIIDHIYLKDYLSANIGVITKFEGNYKFFVILGVSYYFFNSKNYHLILNNDLYLLLNSVNISNTLSLRWMYIF